MRLATYDINMLTREVPPIRRPNRPSVSDLDDLFRGFADPTRLRLLNALVSGPLCVGDLVEILKLPQPLVSRHLAYLRRVGLVQVERDAKYARYSIAPASTPVHASLLECVRTCFIGIASLSRERRAATKLVAQPFC